MRVQPLHSDVYEVVSRNDGTVLVRVRSADRGGCRLPDAVFTFRHGDPQYGYWARRAQGELRRSIDGDP